MKKLKLRFKRALAAFLRDELLEYIGYNERSGYNIEPIRVNHVDFEVVQLEGVINCFDLESRRVHLEAEIEHIKHKFTKEVMRHIEVDAQDLVYPHIYPGAKKITLRLMIKKRPK